MSDLRDSSVFDARLLDFVQKLLLPGAAPPSSISAFEKKLLVHRQDVRDLDDAIPSGLMKIIRESRSYVTPEVALQFLLYSRGKDQLQDALQILYYAVRDGVVLSRQEIQTILRDSRELPVQWILTLLGSSSESRLEGDGEKPAKGVQLPRDFV